MCRRNIFLLSRFRHISFLIYLLAFNSIAYSTAYTWNGSVSSVWGDQNNWTPNTGVPGAADDITINNSGISPVYDGVAGVTNFTITSGTLDLGGFTLSISGNGTFTAGTLNNGTINVTAATTTTFGAVAGSPVFGANVIISSGTVTFRNSTFNGTASITKTGASNDVCTGNNTFNGTTTIINNGTGQLRFANTTRDIFNADVTFTNNNSSIIYVAYNDASGTQFNGNIIVENTGTGGVRFGQNNGTATLANGKTISIGSNGFSDGQLRLRNFTQAGATAQSLTLTGVADLFLESGSVFNANVNFVSPQFHLNGTTFNGTVYAEKNGATNNAGTGGNTFNQTTTLLNSGSGYFMTGNASPDIFNADVTLTSTGSERVLVAWASAGNQFNGNIIVNSTGSSVGIGMCGNAAGSATLANGKTISVGGSGFSAGYLLLNRLNQVGNTPLNLTLAATASYISFGPASTFGANITATAPGISFDGSTFNGTVSATKTGASSETGNGGNTFNQTTTIINNGTGYLGMGWNNPDIFNTDVTFTNTNTNIIYVAHASAANQFNGNIYFNNTGTGSIRFGQNTGTATLSGGKTLNVGGSGVTDGSVRLMNLTQAGNTAQGLTFTNNATLYLQNGTSFTGDVNFTAPSIRLDGSTYNGLASFTKNGSANDAGIGGNTFSNNVTVSNSGSGYLQFNGAGNDAFNGNIIVNNTGTGGIRFGQNAGTATLAAGKTISVGGGGFTDGSLRFMNFIQTGATAQSLTLTGIAALYLQTGTTFNGNVNFVAPQLYLNGSTFNGTSYLEKNGATSNAGNGGNTFNEAATIVNSGTNYLMTGNVSPDIFNWDATFTNTNTSIIHVAYASAGTQFNGNIYFNTTASGDIRFGQNSGTASLANGKTLNVGASGVTDGAVRFMNFTQSGATAQNLTFTNIATLYLQSGTTFNGNVNFISPQLYLDGSTFNGTANLEKSGATGNTGAGNNTFNGTTTIKNDATSSGVLRTNGGNVFNAATTIQNDGSADVLLERISGSTYNAQVTFTNTGSSYIRAAYAGASTFSDNMIFNSTNGTGIYFCESAGSTASIANTKTLSVGGTGFSAGELRLQSFTQIGGTAQALTFTGTGSLRLQTGTTFNGNVNFVAPQMYLDGVTCNGTATLIKNGATNNSGAGNNTFNGTTLIRNDATSTGVLRTNGGNIFNATTTIENLASADVLLELTSGSTYNFPVTFTNSGSSDVRVAYAGATSFNDNIIFNSTSTIGIYFCESAGSTASLANGKTISVGATGFSAGELRLKSFTQVGGTAQALTFTGTGSLRLQAGSTFNGNVNFVAPQMYLDGVTCNGTAYLEKNGATSNAGNGGNTFNQTATIVNSSNSAYFGLGWTNPDVFNADVTFTNSNTNIIYVGYNAANNQFNGNIFLNSTGTGSIRFSQNTGTSILAAGKTLNVGASGVTDGSVRLMNFTQNGATAQNLTFTNVATLYLQTGTTFNGNVNFISPQMFLNGSTFNGTAYIEKNGATANTSTVEILLIQPRQ